MKCLIQRVKKASVTINNKLYSEIKAGLLVFLGVEKGDTLEQAAYLADKLVKLRIFEDSDGKMNKSIRDIAGEILIVSQFTLCGNCKKGTRPSFDNSEKPELAKKLYEDFVTIVKSLDINTKTGEFAAMMDIELINDGPVTFMLEKQIDFWYKPCYNNVIFSYKYQLERINTLKQILRLDILRKFRNLLIIE